MTTLTLYRYRLARTADEGLFVYGYDRSTADVRIVELQAFDESTMTGTAKDGRTVVLEGNPALDMNAGWFWAYYCAEHSLGVCTDATPADIGPALLRSVTVPKSDTEAQDIVRQRYGEGRELGDTPAGDEASGNVRRS